MREEGEGEGGGVMLRGGMRRILCECECEG